MCQTCDSAASTVAALLLRGMKLNISTSSLPIFLRFKRLCYCRQNHLHRPFLILLHLAQTFSNLENELGISEDRG